MVYRIGRQLLNRGRGACPRRATSRPDAVIRGPRRPAGVGVRTPLLQPGPGLLVRGSPVMGLVAPGTRPEARVLHSRRARTARARRTQLEVVVRRSTSSSLGDVTASTVETRTNAPAEIVTNQLGIRSPTARRL